jgi:hypothetical protein
MIRKIIEATFLPQPVTLSAQLRACPECGHSAQRGQDPLADLDDATNRCSQCALGILLIRRSAVAAGPIQQVT